MKLLFVTDNGFSSKGKDFYYSGANTQHYSVVTKYFEEVVFIARNSEYESSSSKISSQYRTYLVESITSGRNFTKNYLEINKIIESEVKDADAVMCFGLNGYLAYKKAKKYNKPTIAFIGGCVYEILKNMDSLIKRSMAPIMRNMIKEMARDSDFVHYVDNFLYDRYPTANKYLICSDAAIEIDEKVIDLRVKKIQSKSNEDNITIGIIGYTHNKIKGIDTAIRAISLLGDKYQLQVVGRGNHEWLDKLADELKVSDRIEFLGILNGRKEVFNWLDSIDIYIQPSLTEGMPRATLEAMSRACPVVSTSVGGLKTIVDEEYRIVVGDYHGLANKIRYITSCKENLHANAINNFNTAKRFDVSILDDNRNKFYKQIKESL
ncbi:TPA: glycosyltransferase family 4 protein [Streptococcus suis]|nr:glycosyltransferase family 4 protein [Streptococcus suis]